MITRIWHGRTEDERGDEYGEFLRRRAVPDYRSTPGNLGTLILRRDEGEESHFLTVTFWESEDRIRAFAGQPVDRARYYPEDEDFLLEFEPEVRHFDVVARDGSWRGGSSPSINQRCPRSGDPVSEDALSEYRGFTVGFCNPGCRDDFAANRDDRPRDRGYFDALIAELEPRPDGEPGDSR